MSIHKSLAMKGKLIRARNVLKRAERIRELELSGKWSPESSSPFGLPKVRVLKVKKRAKEKKKEEGEAAKVAAPGAPEAAPALAGKASVAGKAPAAVKAPVAAKAPLAGKEAKGPAGKEAKK